MVATGQGVLQRPGRGRGAHTRPAERTSGVAVALGARAHQIWGPWLPPFLAEASRATEPAEGQQSTLKREAHAVLLLANPKMKVTGRGVIWRARLGLEQRGGSGCGFEGDLVPECLELADVVALGAVGAEAVGVEVGAKV